MEYTKYLFFSKNKRLVAGVTLVCLLCTATVCVLEVTTAQQMRRPLSRFGFLSENGSYFGIVDLLQFKER